MHRLFRVKIRPTDVKPAEQHIPFCGNRLLKTGCEGIQYQIDFFLIPKHKRNGRRQNMRFRRERCDTEARKDRSVDRRLLPRSNGIEFLDDTRLSSHRVRSHKLHLDRPAGTLCPILREDALLHIPCGTARCDGRYFKRFNLLRG